MDNARREMVRTAQESWKGDARRRKQPDPDDDPDDPDDPDEDDLRRENRDATDARAGARAAYDAMVKRAETAWRRPVVQSGPVLDRNGPPMGARPSFDLRARDAADPPDRDAEYEARKAALSEAWKNPPGAVQPANASRIERARERMTAEMK
jgi:hypothetical protein